VIPKRNKKTNKKYITLLHLQSARDPTILGMVIEEVCPVFAPPNFFDPISIFATGAIENLRENAYNLVVCIL